MPYVCCSLAPRRGTIVAPIIGARQTANSSKQTAMAFGYENLLVWQKAGRLAIAVCEKTKKFPKEEVFNLTSKLRQAALSVPQILLKGIQEVLIKFLRRQSQKQLIALSKQ